MGLLLIFLAGLLAGVAGILIAAAIIAARRGTLNIPDPQGLPV
ncbi:MAG: hypothetical protein Q4G22_14050 [Paracoccus sp. (in: a-proteobacteria)]|nr:hypothetical protein [Paracoccus sp. (in: a-proteobacteria)]MDO5632939.1 hypothetical protein [Paracoccus sp. (in: a-proteobacteria)]